MKLDQIKNNQKFKVINIPNEIIRAQVIRFGITEGSEAVCVQVIPGGPVIIRKNRHELAIGRALAKSIEIELKQGATDFFPSFNRLKAVGERG
jgi:Fe2+ transport system protein FeoA